MRALSARLVEVFPGSAGTRHICKVDEKRIYSTGHSNGGAFTYLLWAERGDVFAAMAPSAAVRRKFDRLKPKPVMHLAGEKDALVKYQWQELMMPGLLISSCSPNRV